MPIGQVMGAHWMPKFDRLATFPVQLVNEGKNRGLPQAADFHQADGALLHALGAVDHHQGGIDSRQGPVGVFGKVGVARRVEQVDHTLPVLELHHR
jgi:hypothetical protein